MTFILAIQLEDSIVIAADTAVLYRIRIMAHIYIKMVFKSFSHGKTVLLQELVN